MIVFGLEQLSRARADAVYGIGPDSKLLSRADGILAYGIDPSPGASEPAEAPTILFVGTWSGRKRGSLLARVFVEEIRPRLPAAELWMVSDHVESDAGIRWFPAPSDEELSELYRRAWVFCLPSSYEGLGIPYLEALAHRLPVVATPNPGAGYVLSEGRDGIIVEPQALGAALLRLLTDGAQRSELAERGAHRAAHFSWDRIVEDYERAYALAIERFDGSGRR
jgi:glycosyltransferase involved in cell wall biosynthesis